MIHSHSKRHATRRRAAASLFVAFAAVMLAGCGGFGEGPDALLDKLDREKTPGYVFDYARVITPADRAAIEQALRRAEARTTAEVKVVTLPSLQGGEINDFANRLFERWGIGKKDKDNGVLLLAAINDRKMRIEVGYGLEPILPDAAAGRLLDSVVLPAFRVENYSQGLRAGAEAIANAIISKEPYNAPASPAQYEPPPPGVLHRVFNVFLFIVFLAILIRFPALGWILLGGSGGGRSGGGFGGFGGGGFGGGLSGGGGASRGW